MRIMSINEPETINPTSKGKLMIFNHKTKVLSGFTTTALQDGAIASDIKGAIPLALGKSYKGADMLGAVSIKKLMDSIAEVAGDRYVQSLPKVEKEAYGIFEIEPNKKSFLNIKDKFVIYHEK